MMIIQVAFILSAIFAIAAGRIGDTATVALQARTLQGTSFGGLQASAVATPIVSNMGSVGSAVATPTGLGVGSTGSAVAIPTGIGGGSVGSAVATPIGSGANLQAIDLGAIFGGGVTGSIDAEDIFAAAIGIDDEYFFDVVATGGVDSADLAQGRTVCLFCAEKEFPDGTTARVCLICIRGKKNEGSAASAGPDASTATPIGIGP
jgi:hypothetical protein